MSDVTQQLVFAQQSLATSGSATKRNDLVVHNSSESYSDSGLVVGPGGAFNNLRLSYSIADSAASVVTDNLNIAVEQLYFKNLASTGLVPKQYNQLAIDPVSGAVKEGPPVFSLGNLNDIVPAIQADINTLKQSLGIEVQQTASLQSILGYVSIALVILLLILVVVLFVRFAKLREAALQKVVAPLAQGSFGQPSGFQAPSFGQFQAPAPSSGFQAPFPAPAIQSSFQAPFQTFQAPTGFVPPSFTGVYTMPSLRR